MAYLLQNTAYVPEKMQIHWNTNNLNSARPPPTASQKILSFMQLFLGKIYLTKSYVGSPSWRVVVPTTGYPGSGPDNHDTET